MSQEPLKLVREVAALCGWCGISLEATKLYDTPTCQGCLEGGSNYRVKQALQRWRRGVEKT